MMREPDVDRDGGVAVDELAQAESTRPKGSPVGWAIFVVALLAFMAIIVVTMRTGVDQDPRIANPDAGPYEVPPILEPTRFAIGSISQSVLLFGVLLVISWRQRKLHWIAIIAIGAIFTGVVDPLANWATYASLNPAVPHLPTDWPWIGLAPLSEPAAAFLAGYASYYLVIGLGTYWVADRLVVRRASPTSWAGRHPLGAIFISGWVISFPINAVFQLAWMQAEMLVYTQFWGPMLHVGELRLPLLILFYDPFVYATIAIMCRRDDEGESIVLRRVAAWLPGRQGHRLATSGRQVIAAGLLMILSIMGPITVFSIIRLSGLATTVAYETWPFPPTKVPDPSGLLEDSGKPGPFMR
jgi:hypothetical protein